MAPSVWCGLSEEAAFAPHFEVATSQTWICSLRERFFSRDCAEIFKNEKSGPLLARLPARLDLFKIR
jgi:hypothetical protein